MRTAQHDTEAQDTLRFGFSCITPKREITARIDAIIARLDVLISRQVDEIRRQPEFAALQARWHGLGLLVDAAGQDGTVTIQVLNVDWPKLARDLERAPDFDQSHLYRLVYEGEFGMPGGMPIGVMICDFALSHRARSGSADPVDAIRRLSAVGAAAFCPFIAAAEPTAYGLDDEQDLSLQTRINEPRQIRREDPSFARWTSFRKSEDSRFLGLITPSLQIVQRDMLGQDRPYLPRGHAAHVLPLNASFGFGLTVIEAFKQSGWFSAIRGAYQNEAGGGRVSGIDPIDLETDLHGLSAQTPLNARLTSAQEEALNEHGVIPLATLYFDAEPVFNMLPSVHLPATYDEPVATQNARLASMLQYVLCTSRFAHYLKVIMRDEIGTIADPVTIEEQLTKWLRGYCLGNDDADDALKALYPLRDAGVSVAPIRGKPGSYGCTIRLQPHFQLDDVSTSFHLVADTTAEMPHEGATS